MSHDIATEEADDGALDRCARTAGAGHRYVGTVRSVRRGH